MGEKENTNTFREWIESIPMGDFPAIREPVIIECHITRQIFNHWKLGNTKIPPLAQEKINQIEGKEIFKIEKKKIVLS